MPAPRRDSLGGIRAEASIPVAYQLSSASLMNLEQSTHDQSRSVHRRALIEAADMSTSQRLRRDINAQMNHVLTDIIVGAYSACYLLMIVIDMMLDEILSADASPQEQLHTKDRHIIWIDLGFLCLFLVVRTPFLVISRNKIL